MQEHRSISALANQLTCVVHIQGRGGVVFSFFPRESKTRSMHSLMIICKNKIMLSIKMDIRSPLIG
jgi:hypothetical protein